MKAYSVVATAMTLSLGVTSALASKGAENGKPFQALQQQINENASQIESNANAILNLNADISGINTRIDNVETDISQLEIDVASNSGDIASALERITISEEGIASLQANLSVLAAQHAADNAAINAAINDIQLELVHLNSLREALAADLSQQLAALSANVDANTFAIDNVLVQLISVNAQLTSINSSILTVNGTLDALEDAQADNNAALAELEDRVATLEGAVDTLQSYHLYTFSGIATNVLTADLNGWNQCYTASYNNRNAHPEDMVAACTGSKIMLACRQTGSDTLTVAAYADRDEVFLVTGDRNNVVHEANGADWYFSYNYSMGFAPVGEGVTRSSADVQDRNSPNRLSWHTHDTFAGGWRCGSATSLNSSSAWEKVVFQAD